MKEACRDANDRKCSDSVNYSLIGTRHASAHLFVGQKQIFLLSVLFLVLFALNANGQQITCSFQSTCDNVSILYVENDTGGYLNSHAQLSSNGSYAYSLCCFATDINLTNSCSYSDPILRLSDVTNAHLQTANTTAASYVNDVCLGATNGSVLINYVPVCQGSYNAIASLSNDTNAHIGDSLEYGLQICALGSISPTTEILFPSNSYSTTLQNISLNYSSDSQGVNFFVYVNGVFDQNSSVNTTINLSIGNNQINVSGYDGINFAQNVTINVQVLDSSTCDITNSNLVNSTVDIFASANYNCTITSSNIFNSLINSSQIIGSTIDSANIFDSHTTLSYVNSSDIFYSKIENATLCSGMSVSNAYLRNDTLVTGLISYNGNNFFAPKSISNICAGQRPASIGEITSTPIIINNSNSLVFTYSAGLGYTVEIRDLINLDNSSRANLSLLDSHSQAGQLNDGTYANNFSISSLNNNTDSNKTLTAYVNDNLGNNWTLKFNVTLDNTKPNATIEIFGGTGSGLTNQSTETTTFRTVTLVTSKNDSIGIDSCRYANEDYSFSDWEDCYSARAWLLTSGDGFKTVVYEVRDLAGNIQRINDTITLNASGINDDTTPPTTPVVTDGGNYHGSDNFLDFKISSSDPQSAGLRFEYRISYNNSNNIIVNWTPVGSESDVSVFGLSLINNTNYTIDAKATNDANLVSSVGSSDGIIIDITDPEAPIISSTHNSTWSSSPQVAINFSANDTISGVNGFSYILSLNQSQTPDRISESETDHIAYNLAQNDGSISVLKYNNSGNASVVFIEVLQNISKGDVLRVTLNLLESHTETSDEMSVRLYVTNITPTDFNFSSNNVSRIVTVTQDITYKSEPRNADPIIADIEISNDISVPYYLAIEGDVDDDDNNLNILLAADTTTADNSSQTFICMENSTCINTSSTFDFSVKIENRDVRADGLWDKILSVPDGKFYFNVRARDQVDNWGNYSSRPIFVDTSGPSTPTMINPMASSSELEINFSWTEANDIDSGVLTYYLVVDNDSDFSSPVYNSNVGNVTLASISVSQDGTYHAKVLAANLAGVNGSFSNTITTGFDTTPPAITFLKPFNSIVRQDIRIVARTNEKAICSFAYTAPSVTQYQNFTYTNDTLHEVGSTASLGANSMNVRCSDAAGNTNVTTTSFTVDSSLSPDTITVPDTNVFTDELVTLDIQINDGATGVGEILKSEMGLYLNDVPWSFSFFDNGDGSYSVSFLAPADNNTYPVRFTAMDAIGTSTLEVQDLLLSVQYTNSGLSAQNLDNIVYDILGTYSIGLASDSKSVSTSSTANTLNIAADGEDGFIFIFATKPSTNIERLIELLEDNEFLDSINPSFGYQVDEQTYIVYTELDYNKVQLEGNDTLTAGSHEVRFENLGEDPITGKTRLILTLE